MKLPVAFEISHSLLFCFFHHLSPMGPINELQRCPSRVWSQGISAHLSPVHAYECLSRCRFSTSTPRQLMVELFVHTYSRFSLRESEEECTPAETRTRNSYFSGRMLYPLDHGGNVWCAQCAENVKQANKHFFVEPSNTWCLGIHWILISRCTRTADGCGFETVQSRIFLVEMQLHNK